MPVLQMALHFQRSISLDTSPSQAMPAMTQRSPRRMVRARADGKFLYPIHISFHLLSIKVVIHANSLFIRGVNGEEVQDEGFNLNNARRRSNSSSYTAGLKDFKTKFEHIESDPVFEEDIHGANEEEHVVTRVTTDSSSSSVDEEDKKSVN